MYVQGTSISVIYNRIEGIKKAYYKNEHILKEFFNEASVFPVPDDAPVEIPRILISTRHDHAKLSISPVTATLRVEYNDGFEKDWEKCSNYLQQRMSKVFEFLNLLTDNNYKYIGVVTDVIYDDGIDDGAAKKISNVLLNTKKINNLYDVNIKYTFIEDDKYYINLMLQNARQFKRGLVLDVAGALSRANQTSEFIGVKIDINDRFGFNSNDGYKSSSEVLTAILQKMSIILKEKLTNLIEKAEY